MTENTIQLLPDVLAILNNAPGTFLVSLPDAPKFTVVAVTEAYLLTTITNRKEVIGRGILEVMTATPDLLHPLNGDTLRVLLNQILKNDASKSLPPGHQIGPAGKTGQPEARRLSHKPVLNTDGDVQYIIHSLEDVTVHSNSLADLRKKHRQLQEAQAISCIGSFEWNVGTEEVVWSDEMYRIICMEPQAERITIDHANNLVHPEDFAKVDQLKETALTTPGHYELTHRILLDNGTIKWVIHRFESISDQKGKIVRVHGTLQDVTDWKGAEQQLLYMKDALAKQATDKYLSLFNSIDEGFSIIEVLFDEGSYRRIYL